MIVITRTQLPLSPEALLLLGDLLELASVGKQIARHGQEQEQKAMEDTAHGVRSEGERLGASKLPNFG